MPGLQERTCKESSNNKSIDEIPSLQEPKHKETSDDERIGSIIDSRPIN